jgi:predicted SAM-dependent methyltransferase
MIALGLCCAGCLALAVPEVAYEGYKYEHNKNAKPTPTPTPSSHRRHHPAPVNDDSVELATDELPSRPRFARITARS